MKKWTTRLQTLCALFGWQGGTIFQARNELAKVLKDNDITVGFILDCNEQCFNELCDLYKVNKG